MRLAWRRLVATLALFGGTAHVLVSFPREADPGAGFGYRAGGCVLRSAQPRLPAVVFEEHHEAAAHWRAALRGRPATLVHIDAHPDMAMPAAPPVQGADGAVAVYNNDEFIFVLAALGLLRQMVFVWPAWDAAGPRHLNASADHWSRGAGPISTRWAVGRYSRGDDGAPLPGGRVSACFCTSRAEPGVMGSVEHLLLTTLGGARCEGDDGDVWTMPPPGQPSGPRSKWKGDMPPEKCELQLGNGTFAVLAVSDAELLRIGRRHNNSSRSEVAVDAEEARNYSAVLGRTQAGLLDIDEDFFSRLVSAHDSAVEGVFEACTGTGADRRHARCRAVAGNGGLSQRQERAINAAVGRRGLCPELVDGRRSTKSELLGNDALQLLLRYRKDEDEAAALAAFARGSGGAMVCGVSTALSSEGNRSSAEEAAAANLQKQRSFARAFLAAVRPLSHRSAEVLRRNGFCLVTGPVSAGEALRMRVCSEGGEINVDTVMSSVERVSSVSVAAMRARLRGLRRTLRALDRSYELATVCRSVRDGYTARSVWGTVEAGIQRELEDFAADSKFGAAAGSQQRQQQQHLVPRDGKHLELFTQRRGDGESVGMTWLPEEERFVLDGSTFENGGAATSAATAAAAAAAPTWSGVDWRTSPSVCIPCVASQDDVVLGRPLEGLARSFVSAWNARDVDVLRKMAHPSAAAAVAASGAGDGERLEVHSLHAPKQPAAVAGARKAVIVMRCLLRTEPGAGAGEKKTITLAFDEATAALLTLEERAGWGEGRR